MFRQIIFAAAYILITVYLIIPRQRHLFLYAAKKRTGRVPVLFCAADDDRTGKSNDLLLMLYLYVKSRCAVMAFIRSRQSAQKFDMTVQPHYY